MGRKAKPTTIEDAIERLQSKLVDALAKADPTKKSPASVLNILHALYAAQAGLALSSTEAVSGQTLSAAARFLAANGVRREPSYEDYDEDGTSDGLEDIVFPFLEDGSPNPEYDANVNPLAAK